jgi:hypothetical protein
MELPRLSSPQGAEVCLTKIQVGDKTQWDFTRSVEIPGVDHKVRVLLGWDQRRDAQARPILVTNRTGWDVTRILKVYRYCWTGTKCFHRDGKLHLGMGDCQLRSGLGQTRHLSVACRAYSVLLRQLGQGRARGGARERLTTMGQACMAVLRQTLNDTLAWVIKRIAVDRWNFGEVKSHLALPQNAKVQL